MRLGLSMRQPNGRTQIQRAISLLRRFGSDAHLWLPGVGTINGLTTGNYLESTGNTLLTVDNPAGLVLDALGSVGSELVVSPLSGTASGSWAITSSGVTRNGSASGQASVGIIGAAVLETTKRYRVTFTVSDFSGDSFGFRVGGGTAFGPIAANGTYTSNAVGGGLSGFIVIPWNGLAGQAKIDNISVREVTGIHLTQATTASKPILRRGLTNLLTYSGDFTNAAWTKVRATITSGHSDLYGGTSAFKIVENTATDSHPVLQGFGSVVAGNKYSVSVIAKAGERTRFQLSTTNNGGIFVLFDLSTGTVVSGAGGSITALGGGWYLCVSTYTASASAIDNVYIWTVLGATNNYTGDGVSGLYLYRAGAFQGTLTAQQIIDAGGIPTTTTAAASNPAAGRYSWSCDATDLLTATFPAGYESVTVIDAKSTGQVTTAAANIVGSYSIGPSYTSYGRIVVKGSLTASELTLLQGFANKLAGL